MIVVSDTTPIIVLANLGRLNLMEQLFGQVIVPQAVEREFAQKDRDSLPPWIVARETGKQTLLRSLSLHLDIGEAEAIALSIELEADLLLMDERRGRQIASRLGIRRIGLVGVLIEAKRNGLIQAIKPMLDRMIKDAGFYLSQQVYQRALELADET